MWKRLSKYYKKRKTKGFTIMVVPNAEGNIRTISIPFFALFFVMLIVAANVYFFVCYPLQLSELHKRNTKISEKQREINQLKNQLSQIEPSIQRTEALVKRLNEQRLFEAEVRSYFQSVRNKVARRGTVSRSYRPSSITPPSLADNQSQRTGENSLEVLKENLDLLEKEAPESRAELERLLRDLKEFSTEYDHTPTIWPCHGRITSGFGGRVHPITRKFTQHTGVDIKVRTGTQVRATANGVVVFSGYRQGYGWTVIVSHGYGYQTLYAHNSKLNVSVGQRVSRGTVIAFSGSSGTSTGPHLHYEVIVNNKRENPVGYMSR